MENKKEQIGVINEVGDLGLGFEPISEEDANKIKNETSKQEEK